eukprot:305690-Pelagomonas_calceolata.AAC.2
MVPSPSVCCYLDERTCQCACCSQLHACFWLQVPVDVSRLKSGSEWHALHQEAGPAAAGPRHRSRTLPPSLVPQAASPVGGSPAHAAAAAAGQADDQRVSSVADNIPCYKMPASAGGFSFPEKLAGVPPFAPLLLEPS